MRRSSFIVLLTFLNVGLITTITLVCVGGAKLAYAFVAAKSAARISTAFGRVLGALAAAIVVSIGCVLILGSLQ